MSGDVSVENPYRLPRTVLPSHYELELAPDLDAARFTGTVRITVEVTGPTDTVALNAYELELHRAEITGERGDDVAVTRIELDEATQRAVLHTATTLQPGTWHVTVEFAGVLNDKLAGFYRSTWTDDAGVEHVIATTQFESTDARRAFPCFDEPDMKATFSVVLVVAPGLRAFSNGAEIASEPTGDGRVRVRFATTMPMSTYLVAFVVGALDATDPDDVDGVPLRIVHVPGKAHLTSFAREVGAYALRWFVDWYGIAYPADKLDLVALPDFASGAMENLGCVTFREALLLIDEATATQAERNRVATVIAHEIAHMWFGDLVTMRWWNGLWLNEAFATFMETSCIDAFRPAWRHWEQFSLDRAAAFDVDALVATRPIEYPVVSPDDAEGMFDVLTYEKGASVLRMLQQFIGEVPFRDGIRRYLDEHRYGNTDTADLWDALEAASGEPVRAAMDTWIFRGGFPVVDVRSADDGRSLHLTQSLFRYLDDDTGGAAVNAGTGHFAVPLLVSVWHGTSMQTARVLLQEDSAFLSFDEPVDRVVVNAGAHGFYRVHYEPELRRRLTDHLDSLLPAERFALLDDLWAAVLAGDAAAAEFCRFAMSYRSSTDPGVWKLIAGALSTLEHLVDGEEREDFQTWVRDLVEPAARRLGWDAAPDDDELRRELRGVLLRILGVTGNDLPTQDTARSVLERVLDGDDVEPNTALAALAVTASVGTTADWDIFWRHFSNAPTPQESLRYLYALVDVPDAERFDRLLAACLSGEVRSQNAPYVLGMAMVSRHHRARTWRFVTEHWDTILERFPENSIVRMLAGVRGLSQPELAQEVAAFFDTHPVPQAGRQLDQHLEKLRVQVALRERESARLVAELP